MKTTTKTLFKSYVQHSESRNHAVGGIAAPVAIFRVVLSFFDLRLKLGAALVAFCFSPLHAGSVSLISGAPGAKGKLTLSALSVHVDGASSSDFKLTDLLEADFSEGDFHLDYFFSDETPNQLPSRWQGKDIDGADIPGSYSYADGTLVLSGNGFPLQGSEDHCYFLSQPWTGNGVWAVHLSDITAAEAGLMLRAGSKPDSPMFGFGTTPVRVDGGANGLQHHRTNAEEGAQWNGISVSEPFWLRVSRSADNFDIALSTDGASWQVVEHDVVEKFPPSFQAGLFLTSNSENIVGKATVDQILFKPLPAEPGTLPAGVLLCDGTFLAGSFDGLDSNHGSFNRMSENVSIPPDQVASTIFHSVTTQQLAQFDSKTGLLMKGGDFLDCELQSISGLIQMTSRTLGPLEYHTDKVDACVLRSVKSMPSNYEIRLKDGSSVRANSIVVNKDQLTIDEISGIVVKASTDELAQLRAGSAIVQTMADLPWKATPSTFSRPIHIVAQVATALSSAPTPDGSTNVNSQVTPPAAGPAVANTISPADTNAIASAITNTVSPSSATTPMSTTVEYPTVQCWQGNNQEQIISAASGTKIDFPLDGEFYAVALKAALSPNAPSGSSSTIRILADDQEVGRASIHGGEPPYFMQINLNSPKKVTFVAGLDSRGPMILFIDPVAIRK